MSTAAVGPGHDTVALVPVVVSAAGCGEYLSAEEPEPFSVKPGLGVIGSGELD